MKLEEVGSVFAGRASKASAEKDRIRIDAFDATNATDAMDATDATDAMDATDASGASDAIDALQIGHENVRISIKITHRIFRAYE